MYAIIEDSGKQFKVTSGDVIRIDRQEEAMPEAGSEIEFDRVMLVAGDGEPKVGQPLVDGARVVADVLGAKKGEKIVMQKYKRRKGYSRKQGHRQQYVEVRVKEIKV